MTNLGSAYPGGARPGSLIMIPTRLVGSWRARRGWAVPWPVKAGPYLASQGLAGPGRTQRTRRVMAVQTRHVLTERGGAHLGEAGHVCIGRSRRDTVWLGSPRRGASVSSCQVSPRHRSSCLVRSRLSWRRYGASVLSCPVRLSQAGLVRSGVGSGTFTFAFYWAASSNNDSSSTSSNLPSFKA